MLLYLSEITFLYQKNYICCNFKTINNNNNKLLYSVICIVIDKYIVQFTIKYN